jgi:hypothetical protein
MRRAPGAGDVREVERERFVGATPPVVEDHLSPRTIVSWEGSFDIGAVDERDDGAVVTAVGPGIRFRLRFERLPDGYRYTQVGDGPFERMETRLTVEPENEGSLVRLRSAVELDLPLPRFVADRLAAWKRAGELERTLDGLADAV